MLWPFDEWINRWKVCVFISFTHFLYNSPFQISKHINSLGKMILKSLSRKIWLMDLMRKHHPVMLRRHHPCSRVIISRHVHWCCFYYVSRLKKWLQNPIHTSTLKCMYTHTFEFITDSRVSKYLPMIYKQTDFLGQRQELYIHSSFYRK